ncbi:hypothetical protein FSP39_020544 [Pinctada imbricata]|uniref:Uncharacterized protein n=1 Tax=Pinctada imbricata TaxID=66713 RepID=A0AA88XTM2_PINIB|nr:hypothetical protein FSP39_020544 [Pinctada imbricata]
MKEVLVLLSLVSLDTSDSNDVLLPNIPGNIPSIHRQNIPHNDLRFTSDRIPGFMRYAPKKKNLKKKRLLRKLGRDFDEKWMSISPPPPVEDNNDVIISETPVQIDLKLTHFYKDLNLTFLDDSNKVVNLSHQHLELFRGWLLRHGSCPVTYVWEDLGVLFWPRWIRRGHCDATVSCSWPPGMSCVPAESKIIKLLRWNCKRRRRKWRKRKHNRKTNSLADDKNKNKSRDMKKLRGMKCKWLKVPFPIVDECFCSC